MIIKRKRRKSGRLLEECQFSSARVKCIVESIRATMVRMDDKRRGEEAHTPQQRIDTGALLRRRPTEFICPGAPPPSPPSLLGCRSLCISAAAPELLVFVVVKDGQWSPSFKDVQGFCLFFFFLHAIYQFCSQCSLLSGLNEFFFFLN